MAEHRPSALEVVIEGTRGLFFDPRMPPSCQAVGDKLLDVSSWDPKGFGARSQPHWGFGTAQALWATGFQESGGSGKHSAAHNLLG